jgi:ABC-type enterobactin transport system permease subunit
MVQPMIDYDYRRSDAVRLRAETVSDFVSRHRLPQRLGRKLAVFGAALGLAGAMFLTTMLTAPPKTEAAAEPQVTAASWSAADACMTALVCP